VEQPYSVDEGFVLLCTVYETEEICEAEWRGEFLIFVKRHSFATGESYVAGY